MMEPTRGRVTVKYLFASEQDLKRLVHVHDALASHGSVASLSDEPADPRSASLTVESELGFWGIDAYNAETLPVIAVSADTYVFEDEDPTVEAPSFAEYVDIAGVIYDHLNPAFAYGVELYDMTETPLTDDDLTSSRLDFLPWLTILSPAQVAELGRERVLSTPAPRVEEYDDGSVLLVTHNPFAEEVDVPITEHLGIPTAREFDHDRGVI